MGDQDVLDDGEPEACANLGAAVLAAYAVVAIPDLLELFFGDAVAVVDDLYLDLAV